MPLFRPGGVTGRWRNDLQRRTGDRHMNAAGVFRREWVFNLLGLLVLLALGVVS